MFRPNAVPSLKAKALGWLAQRDHSRQELEAKLQRWVDSLWRVREMAPAGSAAEAGGVNLPEARQIPGVLDELQAGGHLSDSRFVESRVNARQARFGNIRIEQELRQKGVVAPEELRQDLKATEVDRARALWQRKYGAVAPASDTAALARQMRFLAARGFTADTIRRVVREGADPIE